MIEKVDIAILISAIIILIIIIKETLKQEKKYKHCRDKEDHCSKILYQEDIVITEPACI